MSTSNINDIKTRIKAKGDSSRSEDYDDDENEQFQSVFQIYKASADFMKSYTNYLQNMM